MAPISDPAPDGAVPSRELEGQWWHQGPIALSLVSVLSIARSPGRYHRAGDPGVWYASSSLDGAWAEFFHQFDGAVDPVEVIRRTGTARVAGLRVLDLTSPAVRAEFDVTEADLLGEDSGRRHRLADTARAAGLHGVLSPGAALSGTRTLVVFAPALVHVTALTSEVTSARPVLGAAPWSGGRLPGFATIDLT